MCTTLEIFQKFQFHQIMFSHLYKYAREKNKLRMKKKVSHGHNFYLSTMGWNPFYANIFLSLYIFMKHIILLLHKSIWDKFYVQNIIFFLYKSFHPIVGRKVLKNVMVGQYKFFYNTSQSFFPSTVISTSNNLEKFSSFCSTVYSTR